MAYALRQPVQTISEPIVHEDGSPRSFIGFLNAVVGASARDQYVAKSARHQLAKNYSTEYESITYPIVHKSPMGEVTGSAGGYLVPHDFTYKLLNVISEESFIYPRANRIPMASVDEVAPKVVVETAQAAGTSPFFGGIKFTWGNSQAPTETEPTYSSLNLHAWDLLGYAVVSDQWLADIGKRGEDYLIHLFGAAAAWQAEYAFLQGTGSPSMMPMGILNAPATISVPRSVGGDVTVTDIANMASKMLPFGWKKAIWACSPSVLASIVHLTTYWMNAPGKDHSEGVAGYLVTKPLFVTDKLPAIGSAGSLLFFDPSLYVIGERQQILVDVSGDPGFRNLQTTFRVWTRLDGRPQVASAITLPDATSTCSPYVQLSA